MPRRAAALATAVLLAALPALAQPEPPAWPAPAPGPRTPQAKPAPAPNPFADEPPIELAPPDAAPPMPDPLASDADPLVEVLPPPAPRPAPKLRGRLDPPAAAGPAPAPPARPRERPPQAVPEAPAAAREPTPRVVADDPYEETEDYYAPLGVRVGAFLWLPAIEAAPVVTTNLTEAKEGRPGVFTRLAPELIGRSDWSRHALDIELRGSFKLVPSDPDLDRTAYSAIARGRVDIAERTRLDLEAAYGFTQESLASAETPAGSKTPPNVETWRGTAALTQDFARLSLTLRGEAKRGTYSEGTLEDGQLAPEDDRDNIEVAAGLRAAYEVTPAVKPFVEGRVLNVVYDHPLVAGFDRDATGWQVKGGAALDFGPQLRGEIAGGWVELAPEDRRLSPLTGSTLDGRLVWSPGRLTVVTLSAATSFEPTTLAGSAGSLLYTTRAAIARSLRRNLAAEIAAEATRRYFSGIQRVERREDIEGSLTWQLNRNAWLVSRIGYERFKACECEDGASFEAGYVGLGLRLQQ